MKETLKLLLFAIFLGVTSFLSTPISHTEIDLLAYVVHIAGLGQPNFSTYGLTNLCIHMMPLFIAQILFGMGLYRHFCTASVYFFSRQKNKILWYIKESCTLFGIIALFILTYLSSVLLLGAMAYNEIFPDEWITIFLYIWIYFSFYTFSFSILLNACAVLIGNHMAFITLCGTQIFMALSMVLFQDNIPKGGLFLWWLKNNPISNLVVTWHSSENLFPQLLNQLPISFALNRSIRYFLVLAFLATVAAGLILCKIDISLENKEEMD